MNDTNIHAVDLSRMSEEMVRFNEIADTINDWLKGYDAEELTIDEVAIVMPRSVSGLGSALITLVGQTNIEYFNNATDKVNANPFGCDYKAEYHFLRTGYPWRLEVMRVVHGCSPVHEPYDWFGGNKPALAHFSFKCSEGSRYDDVAEWMAEHTPAVPAQECLAGYGAYSYWRLPSLGNLMAYVKPRVNLRDMPGGREVRSTWAEERTDPVGSFNASGGVSTGRARVQAMSQDVHHAVHIVTPGAVNL